MTVDIQEYDVADLTVDQIRQAVVLVDSIWPSKDESIDEMVAGTQEFFARTPGTKVYAAWKDGRAIAFGETFPRMVRSGDREIAVMALASVCVVPQLRGQGLGKRVASLALSAVDRAHYPIALFQTEIPEFYERLFGAVKVQNEFWDSTSKTPDARPWWDPHVVIYPDWQDWPAGRIDMNGPGY